MVYACVYAYTGAEVRVKTGYLPLFLSTSCFEEGLSLNMEPTDLARLIDGQALEILLSPPVSVTFHDKIP